MLFSMRINIQIAYAYVIMSNDISLHTRSPMFYDFSNDRLFSVIWEFVGDKKRGE